MLTIEASTKSRNATGGQQRQGELAAAGREERRLEVLLVAIWETSSLWHLVVLQIICSTNY